MSDYTASSSFLSAGRFGVSRWVRALDEHGAKRSDLIAMLYHDLAETVGLNPDLALAQAVEETGWFKSELWLTRHNPCGLGITGPGVLGLDYVSPQGGIAAHLAHLCCYVYDAHDCPLDHRQARPGGDPRHSFHDGNPALSHLQEPPPGRRWAEGPNYVAHILAVLTVAGAGLPGGTGGTTVAPTIAISAGHHNADGGDAFEKTQTGQLAKAVGDACKALGLTVVHLTPNEGLGFDTVGLQAVARRVNSLNPPPAIYLETHTEGGGGTGVFAIHPDAPGDLDTDVRDTLGPLVARKIAAATGLGLGAGGDGVMSEKQTGVGGQGFRLGVFSATEPSKSTTTRLIIEYGAHDKQPDLDIVKRAGFFAKAGQATAAAFAEFLGLSTAVTPDPPIVVPTDPGFPGALQPDGRSVLNGVDFGGTLVRVEWVELGGINAAGERFKNKWENHHVDPDNGWVRTG